MKSNREIYTFDIVSPPGFSTADIKWNFFDDSRIKELSKNLLTKHLREKNIESVLKKD